MPVVTQEIGDTWIYGVASDPAKVARYREVLRLRTEWINAGKMTIGDPVDLAFLAKFALAVEHTWGTDTKTWLDFDHYTPDALAQMLPEPHYKTVTGSWEEKRADINAGIAALPPPLRSEANERLLGLKPAIPDVSRLAAHDVSIRIETANFVIGLDPRAGEIVRLHSKATNRDWASAENPLASFSYQTLSKQDYDRFLTSYITVQTDWAPKDFGKPNIEKFGAQSRIRKTKLTKCFSGEDSDGHRIVAHLQIDDTSDSMSAVAAWPRELFLEFVLPKAKPVIHLNLTWLGKRANRLPEALWFSFQPIAPKPQNWFSPK